MEDRDTLPMAVSVRQVSKSFRLPHEHAGSIKNALINVARRKKGYELQHVLKDISFDIRKGEFFGIVGRNGSGKSTLLKLLSGIYAPDKGVIDIDGKLTPFIELGVGFNPELTGRENVFLNGALLGFNRTEVARMYNRIVAFAELERFMDQKLKNYSSGMQVRLAFSIAIQARSDILVLDEVLAVGDEAFQRKCIKVFDEYKRKKQTVVLVTHDMETVRRYCNRALLISEGEILEVGDPHDVAARYSQLNQDIANSGMILSHKASLQIKLLKSKAADLRYKYGDTLKVELSWPKSINAQMAGVAIYSSVGERLYATNTTADRYKLDGSVTHSLRYEVELALGAGNYYVMAGLWDKNEQIIDFIAHGPAFTMAPNPTLAGEGLLWLPHSWKKA